LQLATEERSAVASLGEREQWAGARVATLASKGGRSMATLVGTQKDLNRLLEALLELDYDAIEAYRAAIDRIEAPNDREQLQAFMADHERHVQEIGSFIAELGGSPAKGPDVKQWLAKGKVVIAGLVGDRAILMAMKTNEDDTNTAYERAAAREDLPSDIRMVVEQNLDDERRHRAWIEVRLGAWKTAEAE
jgi:uncharacterized protein (TIGR02284 family)